MKQKVLFIFVKFGLKVGPDLQFFAADLLVDQFDTNRLDKELWIVSLWPNLRPPTQPGLAKLFPEKITCVLFHFDKNKVNFRI